MRLPLAEPKPDPRPAEPFKVRCDNCRAVVVRHPDGRQTNLDLSTHVCAGFEPDWLGCMVVTPLKVWRKTTC